MCCIVPNNIPSLCCQRKSTENTGDRKSLTYCIKIKLIVMKTQANSLIAPLQKTELNNLMEQVKETIATQIEPIPTKNNFIAANLWNIQRIRKTCTPRNNRMNAW